MMTIFTETYIPYEFKDRQDAFNYVIERCNKIKKSLRLIDIDNEHLEVRCPISGDYLEITGSVDDLNWLHNELILRQWYRLN